MSTKPLQVNQFIISLFLWLIVTFTIWFYVNHWLVMPAFWLADPILSYLVPETFSTLELDGNAGMVYTNVGEVNGGLIPAQIAGHQLAFEFNTLIITYSVPFLMALLLAGMGGNIIKKLFLGLLIIYPFILVGIIFLSLKQLLVGLGGYFMQVELISVLMSNGIALGYQLSTIIIPTLLPAIIFLWMTKDQIEALIKLRRSMAD